MNAHNLVLVHHLIPGKCVLLTLAAALFLFHASFKCLTVFRGRKVSDLRTYRQSGQERAPFTLFQSTAPHSPKILAQSNPVSPQYLQDIGSLSSTTGCLPAASKPQFIVRINVIPQFKQIEKLEDDDSNFMLISYE